jgi:CRISPR-associated endonuclease Csn1
MSKILGLDLGTNSIGWAIRNTEIEDNQIEKYGVAIFAKGVGSEKGIEFSYAAKRTEKRSTRRLYQSRKYRLWKTLEILIEYGYCPLTLKQLDVWRKYNKLNKRKYPHIDIFENWIKLDFDNDGKPDFKSPYQLRNFLVEQKLDLNDNENRYKIGRAFYHIAQRRGFKSSRKDAVVINEFGEKKDAKSEIKKDNEFSSNLYNRYGKTLSDFSTIGAALGFIELQGERIRLEWIQHTFRKHYRDEVIKIFEFQGVNIECDFFKKLVENSKNKYNGAIFYQRPLRSQKGLVGNCTLEKNKSRAPISHPSFEIFRAWSFLNNIEYKKKNDAIAIWTQLPIELRLELFNEKFIGRQKADFLFIEISEYIKKKGLDWDLNYKDKTHISACPVSARLRDIFGENWNEIRIPKERRKESKSNKDFYNTEDIWHILFSFDNDESVLEFALEKLKLTNEKAKKFVNIWYALPEGYAMLSVNAINKINRFLIKGYIYTEAVLLAKIPELIGSDIFNKNEDYITSSLRKVIVDNHKEKQILNIANTLISKYKSLAYEERFGYKDLNYKLSESDKKDVIEAIQESYGIRTWSMFQENEKELIIDQVSSLYQQFFASSKREYFLLPRIIDSLNNFLETNFDNTANKQNELYHPSMVNIYPASKRCDDGKIYLRSPKTGAFKNPMAMRTLHILQKQINYLIKTGQIDEETRVVVELARELNDANRRWAIETYQRQRQIENNEFADAIRGLLQEENEIIANADSSEDIDKVRLWYEQVKLSQSNKGKGEYAQNKWTSQETELFTTLSQTKSIIDKYRLWKEQRCICMYTGKPISISQLFDENKIDFEHTIPRSISMDNSLENLTVCFANYNRYVKKNQIPTQLPNYDIDAKIGNDTYTAIKPRLKAWEDKIERLKLNVEFWRGKSKISTTKEYKDEAIRQRHLWQMELDYWQNKLNRFTMTEVTTGFKNSQLTDTQLISKYAFHYLKSVFEKVEVQKGSHTAEFRKIYGIQPIDEKKDRTKHSHHAVDAAVLTLIPYSKNREEILRKAFLQSERYKLGYETERQYHEKPYNSFNYSHVSHIEENILINNISRDQALISAKKKIRKRGKIVYLKDEKNNILKDEKGRPIPLIAKGDSIRGQLHQETFLGAIRLPIQDENGKPKIENGKYLYDDKITYVVREPFVYKKDANSSGFKSIEDIESCIVDQHLFIRIKEQIGDRDFKTAMNEGIYLPDKNGNKTNRIRHIRIKVRATEPLKIKEQTYISERSAIYLPNKEHKKYYYANNGENYVYVLYQGIFKNKIERGFKIINLFDAAGLLKISDSKHHLSVESEIEKKDHVLHIFAILKVGQKVLFFQKTSDELIELSNNELSKRLYKIIGFEKDGRIRFKHHLIATRDQDLNMFSDISFSEAYPLLRLTSSKFNFIIENKDFNFTSDGLIYFKNKE